MGDDLLVSPAGGVVSVVGVVGVVGVALLSVFGRVVGVPVIGVVDGVPLPPEIIIIGVNITEL